MSEIQAGNGNNEANPEDGFKLIERILALSVADTWDEARLEWEIAEVYEEPESRCLCDHQITEVCVLRNTLNDNTAEVGNVCVKKFQSISSDQMFRSVSRVKKNPEKALHRDLIELALENRWTDQSSCYFYLDTWRMRSRISPKQLAWRKDVNAKVLEHIKRGGLKEAA